MKMRTRTMSNLQSLFEKQIDFQKLLGNEVPIDNPEMLAHHMLGLVSELGEVAQADKRWKLNKRNTHYDRNNKVEEIADVLIFLINICLYSDISAEELLETADKKIDVNTGRYNK